MNEIIQKDLQFFKNEEFEKIKTPLRILRETYPEEFKKFNEQIRKQKMREYNQRPEVKKRQREIMREYYQKPEVKKRQREIMREYNQRPEVKQRKREYEREYYKRNKDKILRKRKKARTKKQMEKKK